jgi:hypothetical protein
VPFQVEIVPLVVDSRVDTRSSSLQQQHVLHVVDELWLPGTTAQNYLPCMLTSPAAMVLVPDRDRAKRPPGTGADSSSSTATSNGGGSHVAALPPVSEVPMLLAKASLAAFHRAQQQPDSSSSSSSSSSAAATAQQQRLAELDKLRGAKVYVGRMDVSRNRLEGSNRQLVNEYELATRLQQDEGFIVVEASVRCAHKRNVFH